MAKFTKGDQVIAIHGGKGYEQDAVGEVVRMSGIRMTVQFPDLAEPISAPVSHFIAAPQQEAVEQEPEQDETETEAEVEQDEEAEQEEAQTEDEPGETVAHPPRFAHVIGAEGDGAYHFVFAEPCKRLEIADMWANYHAKALRTIIEVRDSEGNVVKTYDYTHLPEVQVAPRNTAVRQHSRGRPPSPGSLDLKGPLAEGVKLAQRPEGVRRADLTKLLKGVQRDWKGMLSKEAKRLGFEFGIDKSGDTPVYRLIKRNAA